MKATLTIDGNKTSIHITKESGEHIEKVVATPELEKLFAITQKVETPLLPGSTGTVKYRKERSTHHFLYIEEAKEVTLKYPKHMFEGDSLSYENARFYQAYCDLFTEGHEAGEDMIYFDTIQPKSVWFIGVSESRPGHFIYRTSSRLFAIKQAESSLSLANVSLYKFPFPNLYPESTVCWGEQDPELPSLDAIKGLSTLFFNMQTNMDLNQGRIAYDTECETTDFMEDLNEYNRNEGLIDGPFDEYSDITSGALTLHLLMHELKAEGLSFAERLAVLELHMDSVREDGDTLTLLSAFDEFNLS